MSQTTIITLAAKRQVVTGIWLIQFQETLLATPGQFITLLHPFQPTINRSYSLCNLPGRPAELLIRRIDNGQMSRYLVETAKPGQTFQAHSPKGKFTLAEPAETHIFIAGGTGIAPIRPLVHQAVAENKQVHLLYASGNASTAPFYVELENLAHVYPTFHFHFFQSHFPHPRRLSPAAFDSYLRSSLREAPNAHYYLCGPYGLMRSLMLVLGYEQVPPSNIHIEYFQAQSLTTTRPLQPFEAASATVISAGNQNQVFTIQKGDYVLNEALRQHIALPYSCKGGVCGSCAARLTSGRVEMTRNDVLSDDELHAGLFLTCTALPMTDEIVFDYL